MKVNIRKIIKGLSLSIISLIAGLIAIGLPFKLFTNLSDDALKTFFVIEMTVYIVVGTIFLIIADNQNKKKSKEKQRLIKRQEKINSVAKNQYDWAA